jgi:dihydropteroate synthase
LTIDASSIKLTAESSAKRLLFVTGRLAEFALRQVLAQINEKANIIAEVVVLPISVAALMTPRWVARHLEVPEGIDCVIVPGHCEGDLSPIREKANTEVQLGPVDLRDLPRFLGHESAKNQEYGDYSIEILAEINHAPRMTLQAILEAADQFIRQGADRIDLGCDPGSTWHEVGLVVRELRDRGYRVSVDSFDPLEVKIAVNAGADLVLSVNSTNCEHAVDWGVEVVVIPDQSTDLVSMDQTIDFLSRKQVLYRIDPILEPIGFGFAASLGRYLETRRRYPEAEMMMGIGNLTELTDVDSSGINVLLIGFCEEIQVRSVLTTAVINWARSSVREVDLARRLAHHAVARHTLPKHVEPKLVTLRDPRPHRFGPEALQTLAATIKDPNWRIFAEDGRIHAMNSHNYIQEHDPFVLFDQMQIDDPSHAFYLGYELMKAKTALTLNKDYRQDQALDWGFLTEAEISHRERKRKTNQDLTSESEATS